MRLPFTLIMLTSLTFVGLMTNTHLQQISRWWVDRLGFAPRDLWFLHLERLFTSALVTQGAGVFWQALGMIALCVGLAEWLAGTRRTLATFWGVHLLTLITESALIKWVLQPLQWVAANPLPRDVGPSAGYFACLGLASVSLKNPWRWISGAVIWTVLIVAVFVAPRPGQDASLKLSADLAHVIAFPLGWVSAFWKPALLKQRCDK